MGNILKIKNGNEWQSIPAIVGPQGETGQTGATGPGVASGGTAGQVQKKKSNTDYDTEWDSVSDLPTGGTANQVLKKNNSNDGIEWGGYSVPSGGWAGQVLTKSSNTSGAVTWQTPSSMPSASGYYGYRETLMAKDGSWYESPVIDTVYEYALGEQHNDIQYYQDDYGSYDNTIGLHEKYVNGDLTRLCFIAYDDNTGDPVYAYYNLDYVSESIPDENYSNGTSFGAYGFNNTDEYYHNIFVHKYNDDGTITRKAFRAIYESDIYSSWLQYDISSSYDFSGRSSLPSGGTAGQFLKKTANGEEWADVNQVPSQTGSGGMFLYVNGSGNIVWQYNNVQLLIEEDSVTGNPVFAITNIDDVVNAYRNGQRIIVDYRYANGDEDDNPYIMSGINAINTNDVYTYLTQIQRLNSDGTWDIKQYLFSFNDSNSRWEGIEQTVPSTSSIPEASGVSF